MKKIITAIGNPILNLKIREESTCKVLTKDIQYQEAIFEIIKKEEKIDYIILSELLPGDLSIIDLIDKIKEYNNFINIIVILIKENIEIEKILDKYNIKYFFNNKINYQDIINYIKENSNIEKELKQEIENLKDIILKQNNKENYIKKQIKNNLDNAKKNIIKQIKIKQVKQENKEKIEDSKVISLIGPAGVGKSILTINIANYFQEKNKKILILDFDILNQYLHTILGVKRYPENEENSNIVENLIIRINSNVDFLSATQILFQSENKINIPKLKENLKKFKTKYDFILIDTSAECFFEYNKTLIENSTQSIFIAEANILEIQKAFNLLNIYCNNWNIPKQKINIVFNKTNKNIIDEKILKNIFSEYKILGKIRFNEKYNILINKNNKDKIIKKEINKEYEKILEKLRR